MSESSPSPSPKRPFFTDAQYNTLKHVAAVGLPALSALYFALSQIWHFPDVTEVMATIATVNTILGGVLGYSTATYNNSEAKYAGIIQVVEQAGKKIFSLNLNSDPEDITKMNVASFKVQDDTVAHGASIPPGG
jgi:hypothetical protein